MLIIVDTSIRPNPATVSLLRLSFLIIQSVISDGSPVIQTNIGEFEGKLLVFEGDQTVDAFYGIPFAKRPMRFEKPEPPDFVNERRLAVEHGLACPQISFRTRLHLETDEDCLYLNLFKPHEKSPDGRGYPLLFFIHGGAYQSGSALQSSIDYMAEHYTTKGLVYVSIQYRLGIFGLASNGHSDFAGNYALWDSKQALVWIRENAEALDIDAERITLWGYSSGASMVSHMSLSAQTRDLFQQAIQMSGSSFNERFLSGKTVETTLTVAKILGCNQKTSKELKECLRSYDSESINDAVRKIKTLGLSLSSQKFAPRLDGDFFEADLLELLKTAPPKPTLNTLLENEALVFVAYDLFRTSHYLPPERRKNFGYDDLVHLLREDWITTESFGEKTEEVLEKVMNFYIHRHERDDEKDSRFHIREYSRFISDQTFSICQLREINAKLQKGWRMFNLLNTHRENLERNYIDAISHETVHGSDIPYLYGVPVLGDLNFTKTDLEYRDRLVDAVVNFIKKGTPNGQDQHDFVEATRENPLVHTALTPHGCETGDSFFRESAEFWNGIVDNYGFDIFRGCPTKEVGDERRIKGEL